MRYERTFKCLDCEQLTTRVLSSNQGKRCQQCALRRAVRVQVELAEHRGESYRKWAAGMARAAERARGVA